MQHLSRGDAQQVANGGCARERTGSAGGVKGLVMGSAQKLADADSNFVTGYSCREQTPTGSPDFLRHCQSGWEDYGCGMEDGARMHIVLLNRVRGSRIHHGGKKGGRKPALDQHFRTPGRTARHLVRETLDRFDGARALSCQRRSKPIKKQFLNALRNRS